MSFRVVSVQVCYYFQPANTHLATHSHAWSCNNRQQSPQTYIQNQAIAIQHKGEERPSSAIGCAKRAQLIVRLTHHHTQFFTNLAPRQSILKTYEKALYTFNSLVANGLHQGFGPRMATKLRWRDAPRILLGQLRRHPLDHIRGSGHRVVGSL